MPIRRLVACPACGLQLDASRRRPGDRYRCACGTAVEIPAADPHEAAVVRCSSCGGPREEGTASCGFCGADFTLHERDLDTICPGCMARISDRARFCHSCGLPIASQGPLGAATDLPCPACGENRRLASRRLPGEKLTVLECGRCAGLWLGSEVFNHLEERARRRAVSDERTAAPAPRPLPGAAPAYRHCPLCATLMHRRNYGRKSGVILDTCRSHGIWFDAGELDAVLAWVQSGAPRRVDEEEALEQRTRTRQERLYRAPEPQVEPNPDRGAWVFADLIGEVLDRLI